MKTTVFINRLVGLRNAAGTDIAIATITNWEYDKGLAVVRAPEIDIEQVRCLVIGDILVEIDDE